MPNFHTSLSSLSLLTIQLQTSCAIFWSARPARVLSVCGDVEGGRTLRCSATSSHQVYKPPVMHAAREGEWGREEQFQGKLQAQFRDLIGTKPASSVTLRYLRDSYQIWTDATGLMPLYIGDNLRGIQHHELRTCRQKFRRNHCCLDVPTP